MPEIEREAILYERAQRRAAYREKKILRQKLNVTSEEHKLDKKPPSLKAFEVSKPKLYITLETLSKIVLTREYLEKFMFYPGFFDTVKQCIVRIKLSDHHGFVYRVGMIEEIKIGNRQYKLDNSSTRLVILVSHGTSKSEFTIDFVSNSPLLQHEFDEWTTRCLKDGAFIPSEKIITKKHSELNILKELPMDDKLINQIIKNKQEYGSKQDLTKLQTHSVGTKAYYSHRPPRQLSLGINSSGNELDPFSRRKCKPEIIHKLDNREE